MSTLLEERGSPQFKEVVGDAYAEAATEAHPAEVDKVAAKLVRNAGWYKTNDGDWKQLTPDLRNKINIRAGVRQPDGNYLIEDVDVFYPNQVKGDDEASNYTPSRIKGFIENTNRMINNGGQPPAVVREHPTPEKRANGITSPASGHSFGFRDSPRGNGMVRCNLLVSEPLYKEWKEGKWLGLSAGFACDKYGSNMRFGHIALLGADMQALANLPRVEVFEAGNQLVFAANSSLLEIPMPRQLTDEQKKAFSLMSAAHKAAADAFAASASGDEELTQNFEATAAEAFAAAEVAAEASGLKKREDEDNPLYDEDNNTPAPDDEELDALLAEEPAVSTEGAGDAPSRPVPGETNETGEDRPERAEFEAMKAENAANRKVISALVGKQMRQEFQAFMDEKARKGHQFDSGAMMQLFTSVAAQPKAIESIKRVISTSPIDPKLAMPTFSATEAQANIAAKETFGAAAVDDTMAVLRKYMPGMEFKAEDVLLGAVASGATSVK
jgi:hypothetical protein